VGWVTYGLYKGDYFLFFSCNFSLVVSFALCLSALHILADVVEKSPRENMIRQKVEMILLATCVFWTTVIFITGLVLRDPIYKNIALMTVGSACASCNILFYIAPLLNFCDIMRTGDSSSLHYPALLINGASCILWVAYGLFGIYDIAVFLPSLIGLVFVIIALGMCYYYPATHHINNPDADKISPYALYQHSRQLSMNSMVSGLSITGLYVSQLTLSTRRNEDSTSRHTNRNARSSTRKDEMLQKRRLSLEV
jgi:hypothetical protein